MKIVMVVNQSLSPGLAANTAAVLGISLGQSNPGIVGPEVADASCHCHEGITRHTIPVLASDAPTLAQIFQHGTQDPDIRIMGFNTIAQQSRHYDEYARKLAQVPTPDLVFSGLCILGTPGAVNSLTGTLKLYG